MPVCLLNFPPPSPAPTTAVLFFYPLQRAACCILTLHAPSPGQRWERSESDIKAFFFLKHSRLPVCCDLSTPSLPPASTFMRPCGDATQARVVCSLMKLGKTNKLIKFEIMEKKETCFYCDCAVPFNFPKTINRLSDR